MSLHLILNCIISHKLGLSFRCTGSHRLEGEAKIIECNVAFSIFCHLGIHSFLKAYFRLHKHILVQ